MTQLTDVARVQTRARQLEVLQLVIQGLSNDEIAKITGLDDRFIETAPGAVMRRQEAADVDYYRMLQNERLNTMLSSWWDRGMVDVDSAAFVLKLVQEQSKLNGLYKNTSAMANFSPVEFQQRLQQYIEFEVERRIRTAPKEIEVETVEVETDD